jgi:hypothetical protein
VLEEHEDNMGHIETMSKWFELEQQLLEGKAIDYENQRKQRNTGRMYHKD